MDPKLQRRHERIQVSIQAQFGVLVPEATFQPALFMAEVCDLSERGAMVNVCLDHQTYVALLQRTRYCRLALPAGEGLPDRIIGKAVWIQPVGRGDEKTYRIGLFFDEIDDRTAEQIKAYVDWRVATGENG